MAGIARVLLWLAARLPPRAGWRVCRWLAWLMIRFRSETARITSINLRLCMPDLDEAELQSLVRGSINDMLFLFFEFAYQAHWSQERLMSRVVAIEGRDVLDRACAQDRGVLMVVPHYGNWEMLCVYLGANYKLSALYDPPKLAALEPIVRSVRERFEAELFPIDTGGMRSFLKKLRGGYIAAILPDQVPSPSAGVYADFFGHPALTMTLPHRMYTRNDPVPIMGWVKREWHDGALNYRVCFRDLPLWVDPRDDLRRQQTACATSINRAIEQVIRADPAQYQWEYKRFKRPPPDGRGNVYRRQ